MRRDETRGEERGDKEKGEKLQLTRERKKGDKGGEKRDKEIGEK